jgi:hypothetical protein
LLQQLRLLLSRESLLILCEGYLSDVGNIYELATISKRLRTSCRHGCCWSGSSKLLCGNKLLQLLLCSGLRRHGLLPW